MRVIVPELLDSLPADDPGAVASRRDLRRINAVMGNFRWLQRRTAECLNEGRNDLIVEVGAGDGGLARRICSQNPARATNYHGLDFAPRPARWPTGAVWHQTDLWSGEAAELLGRATILIANMVLHHFEAASLRRLGALLTHCRTVLACEPCRREIHVWQGRLCFPFLHRITRHDMVVSIRAGFRNDELAAAMALEPAQWRSRASETILGAYRMTAVRNL